MNKIKNRLSGLFNKYTILLLFTYFVFGVGFSYAYFAYTYENTTTIVGNVIAINATLDVQQVVGSNEKMVPMQNLALSNALNGAQNGGQAACVDANGNLSCQVYKITLTNNASRLQHITGTIELYAKDGAGNVYNNLRWQELTSPTAVKTGSIVNRMEKSLLATDITMNTGDTLEWYIAVWISEMDYDQTNTDKGQFGGTVTFETTDGSISNLPNSPNLDNGNLIPVYYDDTAEVWKKADSTNKNNSWYNYSNKMWANAVIIGDSTKKATFQSATPGTTITDSDITAFYVWIPRYKYRVWNITRQAGEESTYAYTAYSTGIEIQFEEGISSTGNVECTYDVTTEESETNLSDNCYYNGSSTPITTSDLNVNYTDAWYTHPAFTFGEEEKTGFWIGKFETTGDATTPTVLPDESSLSNQTVSEQFTTSKKFQYYLSNETDAYMLTNLEWGAVAYLTHSIYGLCNGTTCEGLNHNNSEGNFTGRSGGAIASDEALHLTNIYPNDASDYDSETSWNENGYYTYRGYFIDYNGYITSTKDISKVASTTKNVTGVYDMSGGGEEQVMGNMVDIEYQFNPFGGGDSWDGNSILDSKFYNAYSFGDLSVNQSAYNRSRLGDATAETLGADDYQNDFGDYVNAWQIGNSITGSFSFFTNGDSYIKYYEPWFYRGGSYYNTSAGVFSFDFHEGESSYNRSFRSSLS